MSTKAAGCSGQGKLYMGKGLKLGKEPSKQRGVIWVQVQRKLEQTMPVYYVVRK